LGGLHRQIGARRSRRVFRAAAQLHREATTEMRAQPFLTGLVDSDTSPIRLTFKRALFKTMAKAYWISAYRSVRDQDALAAYAKLAGPALQAAGGRFLARGLPARVYEDGLEQRLVLIEFDSVAQAIAAHDSPAYQQALRVLGNAVDRDLRIVGGVE
jgi:uncharacterized protein (DUF1330 family)